MIAHPAPPLLSPPSGAPQGVDHPGGSAQVNRAGPSSAQALVILACPASCTYGQIAGSAAWRDARRGSCGAARSKARRPPRGGFLTAAGHPCALRCGPRLPALSLSFSFPINLRASAAHPKTVCSNASPRPCSAYSLAPLLARSAAPFPRAAALVPAPLLWYQPPPLCY